jgi:hypothetical protein
MKKFQTNVLELAKTRASYKKKGKVTYSHFDDTSEYSSTENGSSDSSDSSSYESSASADSSRPRWTNSSASNATLE